jgi:hypothetical protein
MRLDSLEGEAREGATLWMSAVACGVAGMDSRRAQALGRGPSVDMVRAGRRFVEDARWRIGGGEREAIVDERRGKREKGKGRRRTRKRMEYGGRNGCIMIGHMDISAAGNSVRMTNCGCLCHLSDSSLPPMSESLQQLILHYLDTHPEISDTRSLSVPGSTQDADAQIAILGALNSLLSREVSDQPSP